MKVVVAEHYTGQNRVFDGTEDEVRKALLWAYPFLHRKCSQTTPVQAVLHELDRNQAYSAFVHTDAPMVKSLGDIHKVLDTPVNNRHTRLYDHDELLNAHPPSMKADVEDFERNVLFPAEPIKPIKLVKAKPEGGRKIGTEGKGFYKHGKKKYLIKGGAYNFCGEDHSGALAEMASQAAYHAGGIGHLHQKVHVTYHKVTDPGTGVERKIPLTVIHMESGTLAHKKTAPSPERRIKHLDDYDKITLMDMVLGNGDRHVANILIKADGRPVAIDSGMAFRTEPRQVPQYQHAWTEEHADENGNRPPISENVENWWNQNKEKIIETAREFADLHLNGVDQERAHDILDQAPKEIEKMLSMHRRHRISRAAAEAIQNTASAPPPVEPKEPAPQPAFSKALGKIHESVTRGNLANQEAHKLYDHVAMQGHHPPSMQADVDHFEQHLNQPGVEIAPTKAMGPDTWDGRARRDEDGIEGKAFYQHGDKRYLVKGGAFDFDSTPIPTGWAEMASQAAYHAAGIGHLHQKVHISHHEHEGRIFPMTVVHMEDGKVASDPDSAPRSLRHQHVDDYDKINLMDKLMGNGDRHMSNILVRPNGAPMAIDNGLSFMTQPEYIRERNHGDEDDRDPNLMRRAVSENVEKWWHENKGNIQTSLEGSLEHLSHPARRAEARLILRRSFAFVDNYLKKHAERRAYLYGR